MISGLAITPPILGRISIGKIVERNGQRLPQKDDEFTITTQTQGKDGWVLHPLDSQLREASASEKLRSIPVTLLFSEPELNLRAEYAMFDRKTGRPLCTGDGQSCQRATDEGLKRLDCPSPQHCEFGKSGLCKAYGRLNVQLGDQKDVGTFIFRTTGFNSIRSLFARMLYYKAASNNLLPFLPLQLKLRSKSTTLSHRAPVYYVDLELRDDMGMDKAIAHAQEAKASLEASGFNQSALDSAGAQGFANGIFEEDEQEIQDVLEEFYPITEGEPKTSNRQETLTQPTVKLRERIAQHKPKQL